MTTTWISISIGFIWIALIHNVLLFLYHLYNYYTHSQLPEIAMLARLSLITIASINFYVLSIALTATYPTYLPCAVAVITGALLISFSKAMTHFLILERLFTLFQKIASQI